MKTNLRILGRIGAVLAFLFCLLGGLWILRDCWLGHKDDALAMGIGLYFVGKAFFVGPMLWLASERAGGRKDSE
jgi:hypothetical protein